MRLVHCRPLSLLLVALPACRSFQTATLPAAPLIREMPGVGQVPDSALLDAIRRSELVVLATPQDLVPSPALSPAFQLGAKETWYDVRLTVDSVAKGRLGRAKSTDLGFLPAIFVPPASFDHLERNEIVIQYPAVTARNSDWVMAPPPVIGERAVFLFRRCWNCITIASGTGRGGWYRANPLVAESWASKLAPAEWPRVAALVARAKAGKKK